MASQIVVNIEDRSKLDFFIELIKNFDFVSISSVIDDYEADYDNSLTNEQISMLEERKQNHLNKKSASYDWNEIKNDLKK